MYDVIETTEKELNSDIEQQQIIQEETQKKIDNFTAQNDNMNADVATQNVTSLSGLSGLFTGGTNGITTESKQKEDSKDENNLFSKGC